MTRPEFEAEFVAKIQGPWKDKGQQLDWHAYTLANLHQLSYTALRYIVDNEGNPFGGWLVEKALYLTVVEHTVFDYGD